MNLRRSFSPNEGETDETVAGDGEDAGDSKSSFLTFFNTSVTFRPESISFLVKYPPNM